jgi:hypothetical protein
LRKPLPGGRGAVQQPGAEFLLEAADLPAQRRLGEWRAAARPKCRVLTEWRRERVEFAHLMAKCPMLKFVYFSYIILT